MARRQFQDILQYIAFKLRQRYPSGTPILSGDRLTHIKQMVNLRQQTIAAAEPWQGLLAYSHITTDPQYTTGTASVTQGNANVTGSGTTWTSSHVNWFFTCSDGARYIVSARNGDTDIDLTSVYAGSDASGASYSLIRVKYALPTDLDRIRYVTDQTGDRMLKPKSLGAILKGEPALTDTGNPWHYDIVSVTGDSKDMLLYPLPVDRRIILFTYSKAIADLSNDADYVTLPEELHTLLMYDSAAAVLGEFAKDDKERIGAANALASFEWRNCRSRYVSLQYSGEQMARQETYDEENIDPALKALRE